MGTRGTVVAIVWSTICTVGVITAFQLNFFQGAIIGIVYASVINILIMVLER